MERMEHLHRRKQQKGHENAWRVRGETGAECGT